MQVCGFLMVVLSLSPHGVCAYNNTSINGSFTSTIVTTTTATTSSSNTTTTTNTTTTMTTPLPTYTPNGTENDTNSTTTTLTTTTRTATSTNTTTFTNTSTTTTTIRPVYNIPTPPMRENPDNTSTTTTINGSISVEVEMMNETSNITVEIGFDLNTTAASTTLPTTTTTSGVSVTTTFNGTTTTPEITYTTVTTTTTTTLGKECETPTDEAGNYSVTPYSFGDNTSWKLKCNETHFPSNGLTLASCLGNGVLRPAGICTRSGCNGAEAFHPFGTTCPPQMQEGDTCTKKCDPEASEELIGVWTCIRAKLWGVPRCLDREAKYWIVAWVIPKVIGGFDFSGSLWRETNISNDTIGGFRTNVAESLMSIMESVLMPHYDTLEVLHLWQSSDEYHPDTGELLTWEREHMFSVRYEILIWQENTLARNEDALFGILESSNDYFTSFKDALKDKTNLSLIELWPTNYPISFNETVLAPDSQLSKTVPRHRVDPRLGLVLLLPHLMLCLSLLPKEGQG